MGHEPLAQRRRHLPAQPRGGFQGPIQPHIGRLPRDGRRRADLLGLGRDPRPVGVLSGSFSEMPTVGKVAGSSLVPGLGGLFFWLRLPGNSPGLPGRYARAEISLGPAGKFPETDLPRAGRNLPQGVPAGVEQLWMLEPFGQTLADARQTTALHAGGGVRPFPAPFQRQADSPPVPVQGVHGIDRQGLSPGPESGPAPASRPGRPGLTPSTPWPGTGRSFSGWKRPPRG